MSEEQKSAVETAREKAVKEAVDTNAKRSGIGTRLKVGATRGKNPTVVSYEVFDETLPDTLPKSVEQFMGLGEAFSLNTNILDWLMRGYNDASYEAASDPLAEYVVDAWAPEVKSTFRVAVRNYSKGLGIPLEDAVGIIRPGFTAKFGE